MKFQKKLFKTIAIVLAMVMLVFSFAACADKKEKAPSDTEQSASSATEQSASSATDQSESSPAETKVVVKEPITLNVLWGDESFKGSGIMTDDVAKEIEKQTGVTMNVEVANDDKIKVKFASGDLPDIVMVHYEYFDQVIDGKLGMDLTSLLETNGQNILRDVGQMVKIAKDKMKSRGVDGLPYLLLRSSGPESAGSVDYFPVVSMYTRWDYYRELGYPEVKNVDDYLKLMSDMVSKHPKTADGKKVYGFSGWLDWGMWPFEVAAESEAGVNGIGDGMLLNTATDNQVNHSYINPASALWNGIEMYYKANKQGLVDPDLFTMKYDEFMAKAKAGQILTVYGSWQITEVNAAFAAAGEPGNGFEPIPGVFGGTSVYPGINPAGTDPMVFISATSKHADRAMDLLNYTFSYEGSRTLTSGVKGVHWDIVDGKPEPTDAALNDFLTNPDFIKNTGISGYFGFEGLGGTAINPADKAPVSLLLNSTKAYKQRLTFLDKEYVAHYGNAEFPGQVFDNMVKEGKLVGKSLNSLQAVLRPGLSEDLDAIVASSLEYFKKNIAKIILAKSDEEFQAIKQKTIDDFLAMGVKKVEDHWKVQWEKDGKKIEEMLK